MGKLYLNKAVFLLLLLLNAFKKFFKLFIYLAALGLSYGMWDL